MREKDTSVGEEEDNGRKKERKKERKTKLTSC